MGKMIKVTPSQLENTANRIESLTADYSTQYELLCRQVNDLSQKWEGEDNQILVEKMAEFRGDFKKMEQLMSEYVMYLRKSAATYRENQEDIMHKASRLTGSIR